MYWSIPSTKRVSPTTHMGQLVTTMRRAARGAPDAARAGPADSIAAAAAPSPVTSAAGDRSGVCRASAVLTTGPPPAARPGSRPGP